MHYRILKNQFDGFTLLEVMLAIFIFAILITTVFGSFHYIFANSAAMDEHLAAYEMVQTCFARMISDLKGIQVTPGIMYKKPENKEPPDPYRVVVENTSKSGSTDVQLRFASAAHLPIASRLPGKYGEIIYYLDRTDPAHPVLRRADRGIFMPPIEDEKRIDPILCRDVRSMEFTCYDQDGGTFETWDSESDQFSFATPRLIRVRITLGSEDAPLPFEILVTLPVYRDRVETMEPI